MEFGATTATLTKKLPNGLGVSGRSAYDGVFATPVKLRAPSFSQFDDYNEIFGSSGASSSIPILELPELNERRIVTDDVRHSKLDYTKVFGGFENLDTAVPFEELVAKPREKGSSANGASKRSKVKSGEQSFREDRTSSSKETPVVSPSFHGAKRINMSYHKVNQGNESGTNGTTHIAQLHAVPAYTCLIEEVDLAKNSRAKKSVPVAQDAYSDSHCDEGIREGERCAKSFIDPSPNNAKKQSTDNGVKAKSRSNSIPVAQDAYSNSHCDEGIKEGERCAKSFIDPSPNAKKQSSENGGNANNVPESVDLFYDACEIINGSDGVHQVKVPPPEAMKGNLVNNNNNIDVSRSMATNGQASKSGRYDSPAGADSPTHSEDTVDSNSEAAASVAALRKAIEEAQMKIKVAKESMRRKKEGFPDRVKQKSSIDLKIREKKEAKLACKTMKVKEINTQQAFGEMDALLQVTSEVGKLMTRTEKVRSDIGDKEMCAANEAVQDAHNKLKFSQAEHKEKVELKEADHKGNDLELKEAGGVEKVPYIENTGRKVSEPEESDHTIEMVEESLGPENDEEKDRAVNKAGSHEEPVHETEHRCQEVAGETNLIQETLDNEMMDKRLKVKEVESKANESKDYVINLGGQPSMIGNKENIGNKPEGGKKVKTRKYWSIEQEECQRNLRAIQELGKAEENISQEQKESEDDKVEVVSELEECELADSLEPIDNERACSLHHSELISTDKETYDSGCLEDKMIRNTSGFLDINQEVKHSYWREATDGKFSDMYAQEVPEDIVDHIYDDEEIYERNTKASDLVGNIRVQDAHTSENELEGATHLMEENERERKDKKVLEVIIETQIDPIYEEIRAAESGNTTKPSSSYEPDEAEKLSKTQVSNTVNDNDETLAVTPEFYSCDLQDDMIVESNASIQHQVKYEEQDSVQETNDFSEERASQTSSFDQVAPVLSETLHQMKNTFEAVTIEDDSTNVGEIDMKVSQNQDQCLEKAESDCDLAMLVEETTPESREICKDAKEVRVESDEEIDENRSNSSCEASQVPSMSEWKSSPFKEKEIKSINSKIKETHQTFMTMEVKEANGNAQKVEVDKELLKKIDETKRKEREKEKLAVERAIREARERAFADAKERAALERVATEARQKNILNGRERLKATSQANEKTPAEKAVMEAKLKAERAAVERATAEARARALERALSEKAASDARNKSDKSVGASRGNGMKQNFHSKSFSYGVRDSPEVLDGANVDSAQRCKARSERHQRIGDRVAKALAEKSMRDRLVQKEQDERNRVAEALDADVKRWSSGKTGNLRALLSTLQYILGPDSGWQSIPLTEIVTTPAVKKAYRKATLCVHPDKLQQRGASVQQKYTCEKVFDLLKEAWNRFNMEER